MVRGWKQCSGEQGLLPTDAVLVRSQAAEPWALAAEGLAKRYPKGVLALGGIDLTVRTGSITALVGPNGAGKSTLMKAWVGFERPTAGRVSVLGIDPWRDRARALSHIGYVPQSAALYKELTVSDHLDIAASLRPAFDRPRAAARLDDLGISSRARAGHLSGGQQAQVALAIVLGTRATVLLLDEPLASLDPFARREFLHVLSTTARAEGSTVVLSSHVITDVEQACDHIVVLGSGHKLLDAPIAEAIASHKVAVGGQDQPQADIVARFRGPGGEPLQLLRAHVDDGGRTLRNATLEEVVIGYLASSRPDPLGREDSKA